MSELYTKAGEMLIVHNVQDLFMANCRLAMFPEVQPTPFKPHGFPCKEHAVLMGVMLVFLFPRAKQMLQEGPKGSSQEWVSALIPLALVIGFVVFLMAMM